MSSQFGPIVTGTQVRDAVKSTVQTWIRDYLGEIGRLSGRASEDLKPFRSYASAFDLSKFASDQIPCCVIVAPGALETPVLEQGDYNVRWGVGIGVVVSGRDRENTFDLVELYTAATRALIVQHPSLGGFAEGIEWMGERYDELSSDDIRTIGAGTVQFAVDVYSAQGRYGGPKAPTSLPDPVTDPGDVPTVGSVSVTVTEKG